MIENENTLSQCGGFHTLKHINEDKHCFYLSLQCAFSYFMARLPLSLKGVCTLLSTLFKLMPDAPIVPYFLSLYFPNKLFDLKKKV